MQQIPGFKQQVWRSAAEMEPSSMLRRFRAGSDQDKQRFFNIKQTSWVTTPSTAAGDWSGSPDWSRSNDWSRNNNWSRDPDWSSCNQESKSHPWAMATTPNITIPGSIPLKASMPLATTMIRPSSGPRLQGMVHTPPPTYAPSNHLGFGTPTATMRPPPATPSVKTAPRILEPNRSSRLKQEAFFSRNNTPTANGNNCTAIGSSTAIGNGSAAGNATAIGSGTALSASLRHHAPGKGSSTLIRSNFSLAEKETGLPLGQSPAYSLGSPGTATNSTVTGFATAPNSRSSSGHPMRSMPPALDRRLEMYTTSPSGVATTPTNMIENQISKSPASDSYSTTAPAKSSGYFVRAAIETDAAGGSYGDMESTVSQNFDRVDGQRRQTAGQMDQVPVRIEHRGQSGPKGSSGQHGMPGTQSAGSGYDAVTPAANTIDRSVSSIVGNAGMKGDLIRSSSTALEPSGGPTTFAASASPSRYYTPKHYPKSYSRNLPEGHSKDWAYEGQEISRLPRGPPPRRSSRVKEAIARSMSEARTPTMAAMLSGYSDEPAPLSVINSRTDPGRQRMKDDEFKLYDAGDKPEPTSSNQRDSSNRGSSNRGSSNRGSNNRDSSNRGSSNRGSSNRGSEAHRQMGSVVPSYLPVQHSFTPQFAPYFYSPRSGGWHGMSSAISDQSYVSPPASSPIDAHVMDNSQMMDAQVMDTAVYHPSPQKYRSRESSRSTRDTSTKEGRTHSNTSTRASPRFSARRKLLGLPNTGNTCFYNAVLQGLLGFNEFVQYFVAPDVSWKRDNRNSRYHGELLNEWLGLLACVFSMDGNSMLRLPDKDVVSDSDEIESTRLRKFYLSIVDLIQGCNSQFVSGLQGDAHELFQVFIHALGEEISTTSLRPSSNVYRSGCSAKDDCRNAWMRHMKSLEEHNNPPEIMFNTVLTSRMRCKVCNATKYKSAVELDWQLEIPKNKPEGMTIEDLLLYTFGQQEELRIECETCQKVTSTELTRFPTRLPNIFLCLQIKRFAWSQRTGRSYRLDTPVRLEVPYTVDLAPYLGQKQLDLFDVIGVTLQKGSLESGHYTTVQFIQDAGWLHISDDQYSSYRSIDPSSIYIVWLRRRNPIS